MIAAFDAPHLLANDCSSVAFLFSGDGNGPKIDSFRWLSCGIADEERVRSLIRLEEWRGAEPIIEFLSVRAGCTHDLSS